MGSEVLPYTPGLGIVGHTVPYQSEVDIRHPVRVFQVRLCRGGDLKLCQSRVATALGLHRSAVNLTQFAVREGKVATAREPTPTPKVTGTIEPSLKVKCPEANASEGGEPGAWRLERITRLIAVGTLRLTCIQAPAASPWWPTRSVPPPPPRQQRPDRIPGCRQSLCGGLPDPYSELTPPIEPRRSLRAMLFLSAYSKK